MYLQTIRGTADPFLDSELWGWGLGLGDWGWGLDAWGLDLGLGLVLEGFGLDVYTIFMLGDICYANETCVVFCFVICAMY